MTSWPRSRRMATVFEPIRPVPPITTIFMVDPPLSMTAEISFFDQPLGTQVKKSRPRNRVPRELGLMLARPKETVV
jgi:hypothetical protein